MAAIRFIGRHHTSLRHRTVLTIGDETAARSSPHIVTLKHARNLVIHGIAEWIGGPPAQQDDPTRQDPQSLPASEHEGGSSSEHRLARSD
jgi:hypothetical protein